MARIDVFLTIMRDEGASHLHLSTGAAPVLRIDGALQDTEHRALRGQEVRLLVYELLTEEQIARFEKQGELDCAHSVADVGRFRIQAYKKHAGMAASFRLIPDELPSLQSLGLPEAVRRMLEARSGLVLVTGPNNSGKSTTLAAMVDHLNDFMSHHIITLEDPLEYLHPNKQCVINQRQIGEHSLSFADAVRGAMRADPDVIVVGELRDPETISLALTAAERGVLVLGTLHTRSAAQTIARLIDGFPEDRQAAVRVALSETLVGICSQQLLRRKDSRGRVVATEILVGTPAVRSMIREGKTHQVNNVITTGKKEGMKLLDQSLKDLVAEDVVTAEEAAIFAEDPTGLLTFSRSGAALAAKVRDS